MSDLAALISEGERLCREATPGRGAGVSEVNAACIRRDNWFLAHGPRLLAVAKAAVTKREAELAYGDDPTKPGLLEARIAANAAFDAAQGGGRG